MAETIQIQQRFPGPLLSSIESWAEANHFNRTAAVNYMCGKFFEAIEIERLRKENEDLRKKVVALAMGRGEASGDIQTIGPFTEKDIVSPKDYGAF